MFWIKTQFGTLINLAYMKKIYIEKEQIRQVKNPFRVIALSKDWHYPIAEFDNLQDAQNYLDQFLNF